MVATIIDVAKKCGYSKATVSRAFASPEAVSERAKARIYAAANELNYTPNPIARAMARQKTDNITFVIHENQYPAILNPFYSSALETSVYKGYKQDKIEMRGDRAEMSDFPLYLNMVAGGLDCRDQAIGGFSFVVKIYAVPVVEIIG